MNCCKICGREIEDNDLCESCRTMNNSFIGMEKIGSKKFISPFSKKDYYVKLSELKNMDMKQGDLISISFDSSGGMTGGSNSIKLSFEEKTIESINQEWYYNPKIVSTYKVLDEDIEKAINMIKENNFPAWSSLPIDNTFIATDMPSSTFYLEYSNNTFEISFNSLMDEIEIKIFNDFYKFVTSLMKEENLLKREEINDEK